MQKRKLVCETCGRELDSEHIYEREIDGFMHYFCCSHCAEKFEGKT